MSLPCPASRSLRFPSDYGLFIHFQHQHYWAESVSLCRPSSCLSSSLSSTLEGLCDYIGLIQVLQAHLSIDKVLSAR